MLMSSRRLIGINLSSDLSDAGRSGGRRTAAEITGNRRNRPTTLGVVSSANRRVAIVTSRRTIQVTLERGGEGHACCTKPYKDLFRGHCRRHGQLGVDIAN